MDLEKIEKQIKELRLYINKLNHSYYVSDKTIISDFEFDTLLKKLEELESKYPEFYDEYSPTQRVGGEVLDKFNTINHSYPMLSLCNTYSNEDLKDFDNRVKKLTSEDFEYVCELKFDGVSISFIYENGKLIKGVTRGDGEKGDDVTLNVKTIKSIPLELRGDIPDKTIELRGEIFIFNKEFKKMNQFKR